MLKDLPGVGRNLQDHYGSFLTPFLFDPPARLREEPSPVQSWLEYAANSSGTMSSIGYEGYMLLVSNHTRTERGEPEWPDLQTFFSGAHNTFMKAGLTELFNLKEQVVEKYLDKYEGQDRLTLANMLVRPYSRGTVTLQSDDPLTPLLFDPNYFGDERDMKILIEGAKRGTKILEESYSLQEMDTRLAHTAFPGCENLALKSDAYWECYHRQWTVTVWHPTSTCAMGEKSDPDAVVDSELRVIGTENLRVADASIIPIIPAGNTNAPCIMIGEMAADIIKETWKGSL